MHASIAALDYYLPQQTVTTAELAAGYAGWSAEKVESKIGIEMLHVAAPDECSSDLAVGAARKLFDSGVCTPQSIDFVALCTQTPDFITPPTSCLLQDRLGIPRTAGALDFNLGCSGYIYGLGMAEGLIASGQASRVLLITADTITKLIHPKDKSVRLLFGDAATATLLTAVDGPAPLGPFIYGTNGQGYRDLIVPAGGMRQPRSRQEPEAIEDDLGNSRTCENLSMNGAAVFDFTVETVPACLKKLYARAGINESQVDLFVLHQAGKPILDYLRKLLKIPPEKFMVAMSHSGNTGSSTIPIALKHAVDEGRLHSGSRVVLVGFGVGYSWGATTVVWR